MGWWYDWVSCPKGLNIGLWREAVSEVARLCGDPGPFHCQDIKRLVERLAPPETETTKLVRRMRERAGTPPVEHAD